MTVSFLLVALLAWFGGYHYGRNPNLSDSTSKVIETLNAPKWVFYLCGAPVSNKYPKGTLIMTAVRSQLMGIFLGLIAVAAMFWNPSREIVLLSFGSAIFLPFVITYYLYRRYKTPVGRRSSTEPK